eukprot:TRINITY_DN5320_c0_g2_i1.p1 TRINITY_DN5320_c0_g2~~TRINITY_DN5320_c0_g2_i1.p1  ORF type:complete len:332 (+),score=81.12 TRINITY_DN5320_c0_g2_i1:74-1069(+)
MVESNGQLPPENGTTNGNGVGSPGVTREEKLQIRINQLLDERKEMELEAEELVNLINERDEEIRQLRMGSSSPPPPPQEHPPAPYEPAQQLQEKVKSLTKIIAKMQDTPTPVISERLTVVRSLLEGCCEFVSGRSQREAADSGWKEASSLLNEVHKAVTDLTSTSSDDLDSATNGSAVTAAVKALGVLKSENANQTTEIVSLKAELASLKADMSASELLIKAQSKKIKTLAAAAAENNDMLLSPRQSTPVFKSQGTFGASPVVRSTVLSRTMRESSYTRTPSSKKPFASPQPSNTKSRSPTIPIRRRLSATFTPQGSKSPASSRHPRTGTA